MWEVIKVLVVFCGLHSSRSQFFQCHDDPSYTPEEGALEDLQYTWLGALQYIHIKNGTPHFFRVPRVVLISRQFVLSTAVDAAQVPEGYALGNVAFGEYERDETECGLTVESIAAGQECESAAVLMPLSDVLLHPEYKHFGASDSIALLKLLVSIKSQYMVPACLPFQNYLLSKTGKPTKQKLFHVDFANDIPRDFLSEEKEVTKLSILPKELCFLYSSGAGGSENSTDPARSRIGCTTGCGYHSGAPTIIHEHTGHWSVVALSQGGSPCPDPLRSRRPPPPAHHILVHPYVPWITAAITGKAVGAFAKDDPFGFAMPRAALTYDTLGQTFIGHWWMGGMACYNRGDAADNMFKFYHEIFQIKPVQNQMRLTYYLEILAARETNVICVKIGMPYRLAKPKIWDLDSSEVKVRIPLLKIRSTYRFQVEAWGYNTTTSDETSSSEESSSEDY